MSAFVGVRRSRQVQLWLVAILCGLIAPAYAEDPPATGFQLPGFSLPTNLFGGKQKTPAADDADQPEDASKSSEGKKAKPAKKKAEPQPADPAQAAKEKAAADKAMQDSTAKVVEMLFSKVQGQVKVGSAALNWSEPISVRKLDISDPDGDPVLSIEEVQLSRSLSQMMLNPKAPAGTKLIRPQFFVTVGEENTNLQRVLGAWFLAEIAGKDPRDTNLEIVDGHVHVVKEKTGEQFLFTPLNFAVVPHPDDKADRKISLSWEAPLQEGKFHFEARYHRKTDRLEILTLEGDYAPLALGATLAGEITGMSDKQQLELNGTWRYDLEPIAALGRAKGWDVSLVGRKTQPIRIAVDLHELSSSLLAREVKANPAGGTSPTLPVVVPEENPPQAAPPGPQLPNPNPRPPRDESEEVPVMPTSFRQPAKKAA
ncbi:MAG TPA: hypothetical protein VGE52_15885, partial [Pirellulales bacterium]